jgi:CBS domain containing-hemolysin-like protein
VPQKGEVLERAGIRIEVLEANDLRVEKVRASRVVAATPESVVESETHA